MSTFFLLILFPRRSIAYNTLNREYQGSTFFDDWTFFTDIDPTHGFVNYSDADYALEKGYIKHLPNGSVYIGTDHDTISTVRGQLRTRNRTRIYMIRTQIRT
eukprot:1014711_1